MAVVTLIKLACASVLLFLFPGCGPIPPNAEVWVTCADGTRLLAQSNSIPPWKAKGGESASATITLNAQKTFQSIDGFGASMTESAAYAIASLPETEREALMIRLFDRERGLGLSFLRQPMGSPDFALTSYSYDDLAAGETDFSLERFSIDRDRSYIIPLLKRALSINPEIKVMASPWSPPAWMKTGQSLLGASGGRLRTDCYAAYADYFVRFIQAYAAEGIPIYAVTPQNEINYAPPKYSGMLMSSAEESAFIGKYLGPAFAREGISAKILCYDHNWDHPELPLGTLSDPDAYRYVSGVAWHWYGGSPGAMSEVKSRFPEKEVWFTEGGSGTWIGRGTFAATFKNAMQQGIDIASNWAKTIVWWNIALDGKNGPIVFENTANHGLVEVIIDPDSGIGRLSPSERSSWYSIGHFSRFVRPGALRISSERSGLEISQVAFRNPDGSRAIVLYNRFMQTVKVTLAEGRWAYTVELPEYAAATVLLPKEPNAKN